MLQSSQSNGNTTTCIRVSGSLTSHRCNSFSAARCRSCSQPRWLVLRRWIDGPCAMRGGAVSVSFSSVACLFLFAAATASISVTSSPDAFEHCTGLARPLRSPTVRALDSGKECCCDLGFLHVVLKATVSFCSKQGFYCPQGSVSQTAVQCPAVSALAASRRDRSLTVGAFVRAGPILPERGRLCRRNRHLFRRAILPAWHQRRPTLPDLRQHVSEHAPLASPFFSVP
jgi:hypothetical protein